jgi:HEXXH motif-containing protein
MDRRLREELAGSLRYLATFLGTDDWAGPDATRQALSASPGSPWIFGIYAMIAQHASRGQLVAAREEFDRLATGFTRSPPDSIIAMSDPRITETHWRIFRLLLDTDPGRSFQPRPPSPEDFRDCSTEIGEALALLDTLDAGFAAEINQLVRLIILAVPNGPGRERGFNGASTFFLWGATTLNAQPRRGVIGTIELLVHEASHLLLFGLVSGGALSRNDPADRYPSPLRTDPRPIDGIFHATFVATRVHLAMTRIRCCDNLPPELCSPVDQCAEQNRIAAQAGLDTLREALHPTPAGEEILGALVDYWDTAARAA